MRAFGAFSMIVLAAAAVPAQGYVYTAIDLPGSTGSTVVGLNNAGVAVASATGVGPADVAYAWDAGTFTTFAVNLGTGDLRTNFNGIADDGTAVGFFDQGSGANLVRTGFARTSTGVLSTLPFASGSTQTNPLDRNLAGATVGTITPGDAGSSAAGFVYNSGPGFDVIYNHPGSLRTQFNSINNAGQIVGRWLDGSTTRGLIYIGGVASTWDLPGATNTHLFGVNDVGQVVGYYTSGAFGGTRGFVVDNLLDGTAGNEIVRDIVFPGTNASGTRAYAINDDGTIVGTYNGFSRGFIAVVPEPSTLGLILPAVLGLGRRRR